MPLSPNSSEAAFPGASAQGSVGGGVGCQGPAHRRAGLAPPGWPIGWRARAASSSLHLASSPWFRVAHASVCVRAAAAGLGRAPQPRVRLLERCQSWGAAVRGPPASPPRRSLNSPALGLLVHSYLPVCSKGYTALHAQGLLSSALGGEMLFLDFNSEVDSLKDLLEAGASVNAPPDPCQQSPVHLAAGGGCACLLLWQLQMGADLNQQDVFGEAPLHKAAKVGSLECLSLLVASDAQIDLCNKNGQTAEDLAWSYGFPECAKFLTTIKCMQTKTPSEQSDRDHCVPMLRLKRSFGSAENTNGKRKC
ncbi:ankyrin repeat domain-containing protein 37 isoform X2 [Pteropus vampyrus]|nr:ankyrin repeat domain-containing protein 37 isoform X2 [Pteropus vampyrus]